MNDDTFMLNKKYEYQLATVTLMISNENENQKMCTIPSVRIWLKWLSDATILHIDLKNKSGGRPPTPVEPPVPKAIC